MRRLSLWSLAIAASSFAFYSCDQEESLAPTQGEVPGEIIEKLTALGFDVEDQKPRVFQEGYLVEGDIYLTESAINELTPKYENALPTEEHYSTNNLVCGPRTISVYIPVDGSTDDGGGDDGGSDHPGKGNGKNKNGMADAKGGKPGGGGSGGGATFSATYAAAVDEAISRFNSQGLELTFQRVSTSSGADIVFTRLSSRDESSGILGSAGFPTSSCDPYNSIMMSGILESTYGLSVNGIATIIAHEMGHCIGFRHTDFMDRSYSCGGGYANEGDGGVGANHIPGTPTTADARSWMLACTDGSDRPFTNNDKTALGYLY